MKRYALALLSVMSMPLLRAQNAKEAQAIMDKEFPIVFEVERSEIVRPVTDERRLSQASAMGSAPPTFGVFRGTLNQERHWRFSCWAENTRLEVIQCADMPIGLHRARWVHNRELLEVFAYDTGGNVSLRYVDVAVDSKNPPPMGDPVQSLPTSPGLFTFENKGRDYPVLVHVYGTVAMSFQVGQFPARTNCDITNPFPDRVNVNCTQYPSIQVNQGYVAVEASIDGDRGHNISCDAKWKWSQCSVISPGFYQAKWRDDSRSKIVLVGLDKNNKPKEIGFEVR